MEWDREYCMLYILFKVFHEDVNKIFRVREEMDDAESEHQFAKVR